MIKVLIVEDDPMVASINSEYIQRSGPFVIEKIIDNGKDALEYLKANKIQLLILDIYMPKMNGLELLESIRTLHSDIDVIFVTAARERKAITRGLQLGAVDYLIKPFTFERIKLALDRYLQRYAVIYNQEMFSQQEIDSLLIAQDREQQLPKGIHPLTLQKIYGEIESSNTGLIDLEAIESKLMLSNVTLRKYLDYFCEINKLEKQIKYGSVGRPTFTYKILSK